MDQSAAASDRQPPGLVPGMAVGVAAGLLIWAVWAFAAWDVALALTMVLVGLLVAVPLGAPGWRPFGLAMVVAAIVIGGLLVLVVV